MSERGLFVHVRCSNQTAHMIAAKRILCWICDLRPALSLNSTSMEGAFTMDKDNNESGQLHLSNSDKSI